MNDATSTHAEPAAETWREIEQLVDQLTQLAKADISAAEFHQQLLDRAVQALAAAGGAVWLYDSAGRLELHYQVNLAVTGLGQNSSTPDLHARLLAQAAEAGKLQAVAPRSGSGRAGHDANPTDFVLLLAPLAADEQRVGVLEIVQRPDASPTAQRGYLEVVGVLAELASDFHRRRLLRQLRQQQSQADHYEQFSRRVQANLNLDATAYAIANDGRCAIGCDRVSVAIRRGRKFRLLAVSGADSLDRRATVVRRLEALATNALIESDELWYTGGPISLAPQTEGPLNALVDETHARLVAVVPLREPPADDDDNRSPQMLGALIVEQFASGGGLELFQPRVAVVRRLCEPALNNALVLRRLPLMPVVRALDKIAWLTRARQLPITVFVVAAIAAAIAGMVFVPADFSVTARGELQPARKRILFAPYDGVVGQPKFRHQELVRAGDVLLELTNFELDKEIVRVAGELQTAQAQWNTAHTSQLAAPQTSPEGHAKYEELTAKKKELEALIESLENQQAALLKQQAELSLASPIDGQVLTWDVNQLLQSRPVRRGQALLTVVDVTGPWLLELRVPDQDIRYVLDAQQEIRDDLEVTFILKSDPGVTYAGHVQQIAMGTETAEANVGTVTVTVAIDRDQLPQLRPGTQTIAHINCGRRSIGYVWLHDVWEAVQTWILF